VSPWARFQSGSRALGQWSWFYLKQFYQHNEGAVWAGLATLVWYTIRAAAALVETGNRGLLFSFGRARRVLEPGLKFLLPFLQVVRMMPVRSRTLNLAAQQVTTLDGLVYDVDSILVYRVDDVRKALIEIDDLVEAMNQTLGLSVQELLCTRKREQLKVSDDLNARLEALMTPALAPWGVVVEQVGFNSITPNAVTARLTQLSQRISQKRRALRMLEQAGIDRRLALPLLGGSPMLVRRMLPAIERERIQRRRNRLRRAATQLARSHRLVSQREALELAEQVLCSPTPIRSRDESDKPADRSNLQKPKAAGTASSPRADDERLARSRRRSAKSRSPGRH